jgi:predicted nucleic acid-binding protein
MLPASDEPRLVLDASVAVKWYLNDEEHTREAALVLAAYTAANVTLLVPDHIRYEVASALRNAVRVKRLTGEVARRDMSNFLDLHIQSVETDSLIRAAFDYALRYDCALYDGLYLALADMARCPLVQADRHLHLRWAARSRASCGSRTTRQRRPDHAPRPTAR